MAPASRQAQPVWPWRAWAAAAAGPARCALLALAAALAGATGAAAQPATTPASSSAMATATVEVIVAFRDDAPTLRRHPLTGGDEGEAARRMLAARAEATGRRLGRTLEAGAPVGRGVQVLRAVGVDAETLARQLAADPEVAYAVPNGRKWRLAVPNDPLYATSTAATRPRGPASGQWYLRAPTATVVSSINAEAAWDRTRGHESVVVAVLDTGVRFEHPDLGRVADGGRLLPGYDFVGDTTWPTTATAATATPATRATGSPPPSRPPALHCDCSTTAPGTARPRPAWWAPPPALTPTTAWAWPAPRRACACCRCACWASASAPTPTSSPACAGPPACRWTACRPTRTRRACST
jgi:hypothetical protein